MAFSTQQGSGASDRTSFVGTTGVDSIVFEGNTQNFFVGANAANDLIAFDNVGALETGTYIDGEIKGGAGNDSIVDFGGVNLVGTWLNGNGGDDLLGGAGTLNAFNSTVQGGGGDDTLTIGNGTDTIFNGNKADDTISIQGIVNASTIAGGQGDDTLTTANPASVTNTSFLLGAGVDSFIEGAANDIGAGNTFDGGAGADTITMNVATGAVVTINGDAGADAISGAAGVDALDGGADNDVITGAGAADSLTGGTGGDTFNYNLLADSGVVATGVVDTITDFATASDTIATGALLTTAGGFVAGGGTAAGFATYALALAGANATNAANMSVTTVAVGAGTSWTAYLMGASVGAATDFVVQLGATGSFATANAANLAFVAGDLT